MFIYFIIFSIIVICLILIYEYRYFFEYAISILYNKLKYCFELNKLLKPKSKPRLLKDEDIVKYFDLIQKSLPNIAISEFTIEDSLKRQLIYSRYDEKYLEKLMQNILYHMKLSSDDISFKKEYASKRKGLPFVGLYNDSTKEISLYLNANLSFETVISILIHECTHYYLFSKGIKLNDRIQNEILTDFTAVYLGFGEFLEKGYKEIRYVIYENETQRLVDSEKVGYVGYKDISHFRKLLKNKNL